MKTLILFMTILSMWQPKDSMNSIFKNNMLVKWKLHQGFIQIQMRAPTDGWVAIGFNETSSLTGTYLIMGRIRKGVAEIIEHYTDSPGNYKPIHDYGIASQIRSIAGTETDNLTTLEFTIPVSAASNYHKELLPNTKWILLMAYSLDDDFQHHSIMSTSANIEL